MDDERNNRTLWVGALDPQVTEVLLYELFIQGGPVEEVRIPKDSGGRPKNFAFVTFVHEQSLAYSLALFDGTCLFGSRLKLQRRPGAAVDDTYANMMSRYENERERTAQRSQDGQNDQHHQRNHYHQRNQYTHQNQQPHHYQQPQHGWHPQQYQNQGQRPYQNQYPQPNQYPQHSPHQQYGHYNQYAAVLQAYGRQGPEPSMHLAAQCPPQPQHTYVPTAIHTYVPTPIRELSGYSGRQVPESPTGPYDRRDQSEDNGGAPCWQPPGSHKRQRHN